MWRSGTGPREPGRQGAWTRSKVARVLPRYAFRCALFMAAAAMLFAAPAGKTLDIYIVDTEGGKAALFVSPSGESLLIDAGNPGGRDTDRIMAAVTEAGLKQIDYLLLTHYH